jgi:energy-coupling factor transport system ATP-binding protein
MEITFNNLTLIDNKSSSIEKKYLEDINLDIHAGEIVGFLGDNLEVIGKLLLLIKRPNKGEIIIDNVSIKRNSHVDNINALRKKSGFVYTSTKNKFLENSVKKEISTTMKNYNYKVSNVTKHVSDSLKIVGLDDSYMDRNPNKLSSIEQKKVLLACVLSYNPETIILDSFFDGMVFRDIENFKKLFIKLKNKFGKTIIVLENNPSYLFNLVDKVFVINNGSLVLKGEKDIFYNNKLYKYVNIAPIVEFTKCVQAMDHNILEYTDIKELIKEIYRHVG